MELGPGGTAIFDLHMVTAVVDSKLHTGERFGNIVRGFPVGGVVGVVVVAFHGQTIAAEKIVIAAVESLVFGTDVVPADRSFQTVGIGDFNFMRIQAITRLPDTIRVVKGKHQFVTSWISSGNA